MVAGTLNLVPLGSRSYASVSSAPGMAFITGCMLIVILVANAPAGILISTTPLAETKLPPAGPMVFVTGFPTGLPTGVMEAGRLDTMLPEELLLLETSVFLQP